MPKICYQDLPIKGKRLDQIEVANGIIDEYHAAGYTLTLRQLYYQFVARGLIENSERSYKNLGTLISDGRMAGLIDWNAIEDRGRGIKPWLIQEDEQEVVNGLEYGLALDYWERQNAYVEVWVEKDALSSVIQRPCMKWRVPYMPCKGYLSSSEAWRSGRRFRAMERAGRERLVLIHLGDHDPSGIDMTRDNRDRVELFGEASVEVHRIALNMDQVDRYSPPPNPAKVTDSRAADYISKFGRTSWELDALEPQVLDTLISSTIEQFVDGDLWEATRREERDRRKVLAAIHGRFDEVSAFVRDLDGLDDIEIDDDAPEGED
jgi:hypothetical protein